MYYLIKIPITYLIIFIALLILKARYSKYLLAIKLKDIFTTKAHMKSLIGFHNSI